MKRRSRNWAKAAFHITTPSPWRTLVCCTDECETCPLFNEGCARRCVRWDDMVCEDCPCLASEGAGKAQCVDPQAVGDLVDRPCKRVSADSRLSDNTDRGDL